MRVRSTVVPVGDMPDCVKAGEWHEAARTLFLCLNMLQPHSTGRLHRGLFVLRSVHHSSSTLHRVNAGPLPRFPEEETASPHGRSGAKAILRPFYCASALRLVARRLWSRLPAHHLSMASSPQVRTWSSDTQPPHLPPLLNDGTSLCCASSSRCVGLA
jgi:hypothetical protein